MNDVEAPVVDGEVVSVNRGALVALLSSGLGLLILVSGSMIFHDPMWSMVAALVGAGALIGGYLHLPPAPIFVVVMNAATFLLLLLQGAGLCSSSCGGFVDYAYIGQVQTAWIGCMVHLSLCIAGWFVIRRHGDEIPLWYNLAVAVGMGSSLFYLVIMATHAHWCPSCAASHACMLAQGIMLWRLMTAGRTLWLVSILTAALSVNAVYHHSYPVQDLGPSDRLLGWLSSGAGGVVGLPQTNTTSATASGTQDQTATPTPATAAPAADAPRSAAAMTLAEHEPFRTQGFARWGDPTAPVTVRYHLSLVCPGCRSSWGDIDKIRPMIAKKEIQVEFLATWPIRPQTHHGAQLGAHVLMAAGLCGEDEMLAAADKFFSPDGLNLLNTINDVLTDDANKHQGKVTESLQREALVRLFGFVEPVAPRAVAAYKRHKPLIDANIMGGFEWLLKYSKVDTPRYHFYRTGTDGAKHFSLTTIDIEAWKLFAHKALSAPTP